MDEMTIDESNDGLKCENCPIYINNCTGLTDTRKEIIVSVVLAEKAYHSDFFNPCLCAVKRLGEPESYHLMFCKLRNMAVKSIWGGFETDDEKIYNAMSNSAKNLKKLECPYDSETQCDKDKPCNGCRIFAKYIDTY